MAALAKFLLVIALLAYVRGCATTGPRIGAIANDGWRSDATGRGAASHHGGVREWVYAKSNEATGYYRVGHVCLLGAGALGLGVVLRDNRPRRGDSNAIAVARAKQLQEDAGQKYSRGDHVGAELLFRQALEIQERTLGPGHSDVAQALNNMGAVHNAMGRHAEAEPFLVRALAVGENALGPNHPAVAGTLNNLATIHFAQGRYEQAEILHKRALAILERARGVNDSDIATSLENLAVVFDAQGRYAESELLYKRLLGILERGYGPTHPSVRETLVALASVCRKTGREAEAVEFDKRGFAANRR